jgi:hypothetical protein
MPVVAGDLRRETFEDVWNRSPVFRRIRGESPGGKCGRCEYRAICGGCRARAYADTADYMAEDASCAYDPTGEVPLIEPRAVTHGSAGSARSLPWSDEAEARLRRVPGFVRAVVAGRIEDYAKRNGYTEITADVMVAVRRDMPVDFSKRLPFFMKQ